MPIFPSLVVSELEDGLPEFGAQSDSNSGDPGPAAARSERNDKRANSQSGADSLAGHNSTDFHPQQRQCRQGSAIGYRVRFNSVYQQRFPTQSDVRSDCTRIEIEHRPCELPTVCPDHSTHQFVGVTGDEEGDSFDSRSKYVDGDGDGATTSRWFNLILDFFQIPTPDSWRCSWSTRCTSSRTGNMRSKTRSRATSTMPKRIANS